MKLFLSEYERKLINSITIKKKKVFPIKFQKILLNH